jgi:hypothetical protein
VWLNQITATDLVTSSWKLKRLDAPPGSMPPAVNGGSSAPVAPGAPKRYFPGLPSAEELVQKISGSDEVDKQARQLAAFILLVGVPDALAHRTGPDMRGEQSEAAAFRRIYWVGRLQAEQRLRALAGRAYVNPYLNNEGFRRELTTVLFPGVGQLFEARRQADAAVAQANAAKAEAAAKVRAEQMQESQQKAAARAAVEQEKRRAEADQEAADARVKATEDAEIRKLALADGERGKGHTDMTVFGVPLGSVLPLPDCEAVGHMEQRLFGSVMESKKTCLLKEREGGRSIHWGEGALPDWAQYNLQADVKTDIVVSMTITIPSWPRRPGESIGFGLLGGAMAAMENGAAERGYESELKNAPARVAKAQKKLREKPTSELSWNQCTRSRPPRPSAIGTTTSKFP